MGGAVGGAPQVLQQKLIPGLVAAHAAVAGGVDAGGAAEPVHTKAAVVSDGGQAAGLGHRFGLDGGVFHKGGARLLRLQVQPQVALQHHLHPQVGQDGLHLLELAPVVGGQYKFHIFHPPL